MYTINTFLIPARQSSLTRLHSLISIFMMTTTTTYGILVQNLTLIVAG